MAKRKGRLIRENIRTILKQSEDTCGHMLKNTCGVSYICETGLQQRRLDPTSKILDFANDSLHSIHERIGTRPADQLNHVGRRTQSDGGINGTDIAESVIAVEGVFPLARRWVGSDQRP